MKARCNLACLLFGHKWAMASSPLHRCERCGLSGWGGGFTDKKGASVYVPPNRRAKL